MYKGCLSSLTKKILILAHYIGGMKDLVYISTSAGPNMTVLHHANGQCKGTCMYSIVHLLALASLILGSYIFLSVLYFIYFSIFLIFFQ